MAKSAYETSIARCIPEIAKDREIQNPFWKPNGSLIAILFRTNKKLDTIVIHDIQQLYNYFYLSGLWFFALIMNSAEFLNYMTVWRAYKLWLFFGRFNMLALICFNMIFCCLKTPFYSWGFCIFLFFWHCPLFYPDF